MDELLNGAPCGYLCLNGAGEIREMNRTMLRALGFEREELIGRHIETILTAANRIFYHTYFYPMLQLNGQVNEIYLGLKTKDGQEIPMLMSAARAERDGETVIDGFLLPMKQRIDHERDMLVAAKKLEELNRAKDEAHEALVRLHAELEEKQEKLVAVNHALEAQAYTDGLTGAWNRRHFETSLAASFATYERAGVPFSLLLLDIDFFKKVNDTYGHPIGDEVLRRLAKLLREQSRDNDIVARYGGEEFVVILANADRDAAVQAAERYRLAAERTDMGDLRITISVGAATAGWGDTAPTLIARADQALYRSKTDGRNRVTFAQDNVG